MIYIQYILGIILIIPGLLILLSNYDRQIKNIIHRKEKNRPFDSPTPFFGSLLIVIGYWLLPFPFNNKIFFIFLLDPDNWVTISALLWLLITKLRGKTKI